MSFYELMFCVPYRNLIYSCLRGYYIQKLIVSESSEGPPVYSNNY